MLTLQFVCRTDKEISDPEYPQSEHYSWTYHHFKIESTQLIEYDQGKDLLVDNVSATEIISFSGSFDSFT